MKKIIFLFLAIAGLYTNALAQSISFKFEDGSVLSSSVRYKVEANVSSLLTAINEANKNNTDLRLSNISMAEDAKDKLQAIWENLHFYCEDEANVQKCLETQLSYEIRNIPITIVPLDETYKESREKELVIDFDRNGTITDIFMALDNNIYDKLLAQGHEITDVRRRREILKFVEDYRSYYDEKNLSAIRDIFSDDAIIITGYVTYQKRPGDIQPQLEAQVRYHKQNKTEYINALSRTFAKNRYINVKFEEIKIVRNGANPNYYGVTLKQVWNSSTYSDVGYVFLLWDFSDEEHPTIHVRTWQPGQFIHDEDEIFNMNDFFIP